MLSESRHPDAAFHGDIPFTFNGHGPSSHEHALLVLADAMLDTSLTVEALTIAPCQVVVREQTQCVHCLHVCHSRLSMKAV